MPAALPALTRAIKLQSKAAKVGFDWPSLAPVFAKLEEEIAELHDAIAKNGGKASGRDPDIEEEFGDLLFVVANVARHLKLDPEAALRAANEKFARRFRYIEQQLAALGPRRHNPTSPRWTPCGTRPRPPAVSHAQRLSKVFRCNKI